MIPIMMLIISLNLQLVPCPGDGNMSQNVTVFVMSYRQHAMLLVHYFRATIVTYNFSARITI